MKQRLFVFFFVLSLSYALKDKKINLHDIERDNLANEKQLKRERTTQAPKYSQPFAPPQNIAPSPTHYGFLAPNQLKSAQQYIQPQEQQYNLPFQQYYTLQPQIQQYRGQQYAQYQQYENVPYVTDNHIPQQQPQPQQPAYYTTPQYVYVQPYSAASTNVQSVVSPKGGIQYVMYIPTPTYVQSIKGEQTQNYENVVPAQAYVNVVPQTYTNEPQPQIYEPQQPRSPPAETQYTTQYVTQPQTQKIVQYVQQPQPKREPQSLLESYVPSSLQLQYYKQQQNEINAIRQSAKVSPPVTGKTDYVKSNYRIPHTQEAESTFTYTYQLPSYSQYVIKK